jgi:8-oxo-dGTP diphosphatase
MTDDANFKQVRVGVTAFIVRPEDGRVLLAHRTSAHGEGTWGPLGGHQEYGESPLQTVVREYEEEVCLGFDESDFTPLGFVNDMFAASGRQYVTLFYAALLPLGQTAVIAEPDHFSAFAWFAPDEFPPNLFQPLDTFMKEQGVLLDVYIQRRMLEKVA